MKHPELRMSLEAALPSTDSVQSWLGHQLEVRGIDSVVYTRYIISLLQHDYSDQVDVEELWGLKAEHVKKRDRKCDHKKKSPVSDEERRKIAVLDCLQSVSDQDCDVQNLVDELWKRLKENKPPNESYKPLTVNVNTVEETKDIKLEVTCKQDPVQRYYAAFPALSGEDSPASISPSAFEVSVWKRNPITGQLAGETSENKDTKSSEDVNSVNIKARRDKMPVHPTKKRSKSMVETNDRKTQKVDGKKKIYPKGNKPKNHPCKMQKDIEKHGNNVRFLSWPLTTQISLEKEEFPNVWKDEERDMEAEAEYCSRVEQIIKTLLLTGISDKPRKASSSALEEWPEWNREESVSPELQENFEWYTQPLDEILVAPFTRSKRLYKRHSYPPSVFLDEDTVLESILGPLLSSVTSRYKFVDDVFSPTIEEPSEAENEITFDKQMSMPSEVPIKNLVHPPNDDISEKNKECLQVNRFNYNFDYSSPINGQFSLFECVDDVKNEALFVCIEDTKNDSLTMFGGTVENRELQDEQILDVGFKDEDICNTEVSTVWFSGQDADAVIETGSVTDLYDISSCSTTSFDSDNGTDMSDFEGVFTFDMDSEDDCISTETSKKDKPEEQSSHEMSSGLQLEEDTCISPYDIDVPENTFFSEELLKSFNSVIESPKSTGFCSMLIDRQYLGEIMQREIQDQIDMQSPFKTLSPSMCFNVWSVEDRNNRSCWQSQVLLHEFLQTFDDDCRVTSVPWESVLGESGLRWNLTPKNECEELKESAKSGNFYQLWNVNSQKKIPWAGLMWNVPYNFSIWSFPNESENDPDANEADWREISNHIGWEIEDGETFLSQGTINEDAVIGVELLEELHKETVKEDVKDCLNSHLWEKYERSVSDSDHLWEKYERSVSDSDIHSLWSRSSSSKPEYHRSFELIPSETSAFTDVVPSKMPHVRSAPNLKFPSSLYLPSKHYSSPAVSKEGPTKKPVSPSEHLYFSNDTHFRPIQTPVGTPHEEKLENRGDLFGDLVGFSSGTPYQQFHQPGSVEEKLPRFRPKFKVQKDLDKYIQTGRSLDDDYEAKINKSSFDASLYEQSKSHLGNGPTGDIFGTASDLDDPFGKESGFESTGEVEENILFQKDDEDFDLEKCEWTDGSSLASRFDQLYLNDSQNCLPSNLSSLWNESKESESDGFDGYVNTWSSGYNQDEIGSEKCTDYMLYLQYLPLVKHGELSFSQNSNNPSTLDLEIRPSLLESRLETAEKLETKTEIDCSNEMPHVEEFDTPKGDSGFIWPEEILEKNIHEVSQIKGFETHPNEGGGFQTHPNKGGGFEAHHNEGGTFEWSGDKICVKTMKMLNPFMEIDYNVKHFEDNEFSIPNSVDELSQYYLGNNMNDDGNIENVASTHELLHVNGYHMDLPVPLPAPIPGTAVYSSELEQQDLGVGSVLAPVLPEVAVYSSDLEKQWLDPEATNTEWPPYLSIPDVRKKSNSKIKTKGVSKKPCSFFLEGSCKRSDCKFSHDISTITCRFWEDGICFKGPLCPFLHGYHVMSDSDSNSIDSVDFKFEMKKDEFPELKSNRQRSQKEMFEEKVKKNDRLKDKKKKIVSTKIHKIN